MYQVIATTSGTNLDWMIENYLSGDVTVSQTIEDLLDYASHEPHAAPQEMLRDLDLWQIKVDGVDVVFHNSDLHLIRKM